jgi:hypothetical protein
MKEQSVQNLVYLYKWRKFFECTLYVSYIMYIMCEKILLIT